MSSQKFSRRTLSAFRQLTTYSTLQAISTAFKDEGFVPDCTIEYEDSSERRLKTEQYLSSIDSDDTSFYPRLIRAMEAVLEPIAPCHTPGTRLVDWGPFEKYMRDDGWIVDESGTISAIVPSAAALIESMTAISDISGIEEGIKRLQTITDDAAATIGAAKELVESTAKVLLIELGHDVGPKPEFNKLIQKVHVALGLNPDVGNDVDSSNSIKRVLTGAKSVVLGLNEFRNAGYGTGHGQATARQGLSSRHARLAIHAAVLWCDLVLSTFTDPAAPWKNTERG